jgi:hypothetical protein
VLLIKPAASSVPTATVMPPHTKHHGAKFMAEWHLIARRAITSHQQPTSKAFGQSVSPVARRR